MRIRLEKRLTPSRFMQVATPIASVLLTMLLGAIIFQLIGFDGPHAIYETFITPIVAPYKWSGRPDQGRAAHHHRARPLARQSGQDLEHRRRRPVHHRRDRRRGRRLRPAQRRGLLDHPADDRGGDRRRHGLGGDPGFPEDALPGLRGALDPDAGLCRAAGAELPDRRPVEGPERPQFPADPAADGRRSNCPTSCPEPRSRPASSSPLC